MEERKIGTMEALGIAMFFSVACALLGMFGSCSISVLSRETTWEELLLLVPILGAVVGLILGWKYRAHPTPISTVLRSRLGLAYAFLWLLVAAISFLISAYLPNSQNWIPVRVPLRVDSTQPQKFSFTPPITTRYYVALELQKTASEKESKDPPLEWTVSGPQKKFYRQSWGSRAYVPQYALGLGDFLAQKDSPCTLTIQMNKPQPDLQKRAPHLLVHMFYERHIAMMRGISIGMGGAIAAGMGIGILRYRRKRVIASALADYDAQDE